ncbi:MAG: hypothetical protein QM758_22900 [Armatimonas sp.]
MSTSIRIVGLVLVILAALASLVVVALKSRAPQGTVPAGTPQQMKPGVRRGHRST